MQRENAELLAHKVSLMKEVQEKMKELDEKDAAIQVRDAY